MKILFADVSTPEEHCEKERARYKELAQSNPKGSWRKYWTILVEQTINAIIVGGCAGMSALAADVEASWKVGLYAFGLTFFFEMRKYRKL